jgi:hypothetical protein
MRFIVVVACLVWASLAAGAAAQALPSQPLTLGAGRVVVGGDASVSMAPKDTGFFNYSDYEHSTLRELRLAVSARVRVSEWMAVLAEVRSENLDRIAPFALYARVRPFPERRFDIQFGRIPPTFGNFSRQAYGRQNPLIGTPLAYQYLTSLRADAIPADADELLRMRGRGWLSAFSVGDRTPAPGLPLVTAFHWDTGVQVTTGWRLLSVSTSVTSGTPSRPRISDDNDGKQIATRVTVTPTPGLAIGSSFARGAFLSRRVLSLLPDGDHAPYTQGVHGLDVEYARGHTLVRAEAVLSQWRIPIPAGTGAPVPLRATAVAVEGRYTLRPGAYAAARAEHLTFNHITGSTGPVRWEAPVSRIEIGGGYYLQRNLVARASLQINHRDGGRVTRARLLAGQLQYWF